MRIAYYLFRKSVTTFDEVWKDGPPGEEAGFVKLTLRDTVPFEAEAYLQRNRMATPDWWRFVKPHCTDALTLLNQSNSLVLLLKASDRVFAVSFGHGYTTLNRSKLEPDFGLKATLNSVDPARLRSVQARNIDPTTVSKQLVVNHESPLTVFDVDFYQDLLAKMEGAPSSDALGTRMAGADACHLTSEVSLPKLADKCTELLRAYRRTEYKKHFPFVDQVLPVKDEDLIERLDRQLALALKSGDDPGLGFALPDIGAYDGIDHYAVYRRKWRAEFDDLAVLPMLGAYNRQHPDAEDHCDVSITAERDDGTAVSTFTMRECAVFQTRYGGTTYVLTLNKWYEVDSNYAKQVNKSVGQLDVIGKRSYLPAIAAKTSEGDYNTLAADGTTRCCMDKRTVRPGGSESAVEVCDLFAKPGEFIHVKRHTRSATLSHLLAQGSVSARLFVDDAAYRQSFREALPANMRSLINLKGVEPGKFKVVYAITAPGNRPVPASLPFFTKVNLLYHCREITRMGFKVGLFHIHER